MELKPEGRDTGCGVFPVLQSAGALWARSRYAEFAMPEAGKNVVVKPTDIQREMVAELGERAEAVERECRPRRTILKITNDGRKLALDQRLIDPLLPDEGGAHASVEEVFKSLAGSTQKMEAAHDGRCGGGTGGSSAICRCAGQRHGVPPGEIAFIHDADNEKEKAELFAKVRSRVRCASCWDRKWERARTCRRCLQRSIIWMCPASGAA